MSAAKAVYGRSDSYAKLPPGRHPLPREYVDEYQRRRLVVATAEVAHEEGLAGVTVSALTARARISRKTFYDYFANRDACLEYAGAEAAKYLFEPLTGMLSDQWSAERVRAEAEALLEAVAAEPNLAELAVIHAPALSGDRGLRFQEIAVEAMGQLVSAGGKREREIIASAIIGVIACWVRRGDARRAGELTDEVVRLAGLG